MQNDPENIEFYKGHYGAVIELLEKIEKTKPSKLSARDFTLIAPQTKYKQPIYEIYTNFEEQYQWRSQCLCDPYVFIIFYLLICFSIIGILALTLTISSALAILLIPCVMLGDLLFLGAVALLSYGVSAACFIVRALEEEPLNNPYLDGKAFDCNLLREAYTELYQVAGSANDEIVDADYLSEKSQI